MDLPRIQNTETVHKDGTEDKDFPDVFPTRITIQSAPGGKMKAVIKYCPYNYKTKEADTESIIKISIGDLNELADKKAGEDKPELGEAMQKLCEAIQDVIVNGK